MLFDNIEIAPCERVRKIPETLEVSGILGLTTFLVRHLGRAVNNGLELSGFLSQKVFRYLPATSHNDL